MTPSASMDVDDIIRIFNLTFADTVLEHATDDPLYLPATAPGLKHRLQFAHGFYASALHEIAHWLIAGEERRRQVDFGYTYKPHNRTEAEQRQFEAYEAKNQGLEWILSVACGMRFEPSLDTIGVCDASAESAFHTATQAYAKHHLVSGLNRRATKLLAALFRNYDSRTRFTEYWQLAFVDIEPLAGLEQNNHTK